VDPTRQIPLIKNLSKALLFYRVHKICEPFFIVLFLLSALIIVTINDFYLKYEGQRATNNFLIGIDQLHSHP